MENDNNVELETTSEPVEETVETPATETVEEPQEPQAVDVEQLQATNKKLYERAKKAEAELKALKPAVKAPAKTTSSQDSSVNLEATVLLAQGVSEDLIEELKLRAPKYGGSLIKAQKDPNYVAVKERFERDQKQKEASMPASRGAGSVKAEKTFTTPGLSREEHAKMVKAKMGL